jgi:glycosyltransferase involved in cell wall biosynthesis
MTRTVAVVAAYYPPRIGGVERYAAEVARAVAAEPGWDAAVITTGDTRLRTRVSVQDGVRVVRLGVWLTLSNSPLNPLWPLQVRRWLRRLGADVVNAHGPVPGLADLAVAVAGKRPAVLTYHAGSMHKGEPGTRLADALIAGYERFVLPRVFSRADALVAVSPVALAARRPGAVQITPGVDVRRFTPGPPPSARPRDLVYVGRIDRTSAWKGVDVAIRALTHLADRPDVRLRLVGDGDALAEQLELAAELGVADRVHSTGALAGDALAEAVRSAAVLVLPSLTEAESFGMAAAEALACGTPVVASDVPGPAFVLADSGAGLLVPPGDAAALARACRTVLDDPDLADRMGAAGRRHAELHYAWPALTRRYLELFSTLTSPRTRSSR